MSSVLKSKNEQVDTFVKKSTGNQSGKENSPWTQLSAKEKEPHDIHSFEWMSVKYKNPTSVTCTKARTIEDTLKTSSQFKKIANQNKDKELVILRDGKAISSHFPCCLIKNERLKVKYVKAVDRLTETVRGSGLGQRKAPSGDFVTFNVLSKGGKNVVKFLTNPILRTTSQEITVYGYKGEKLKDALRRDGRLKNAILKKNCVLSHTTTEVNTELSSPIDDLDGKTFKLILLNHSPSPGSQSGSLDDAQMMRDESPKLVTGENLQHATMAESVDDNKPEEMPKLSSTAILKSLKEIPNSAKMQRHLSSQIKNMEKRVKTPRHSPIQKFLYVEFEKNSQLCNEVETMKKLMQLSDSVCQVRVDGRPAGTGFLLFDRFVLTNGHVIQNYIHESTGQLLRSVTTHFSVSSVDSTQQAGVTVEEVVGFEHCFDVLGQTSDWALLRLCADQKLPDALLPHFGFNPQWGGICLIGHPDGGVKKFEPCAIIQRDSRNQVIAEHYHENPEGVLVEDEYNACLNMVTGKFFENVASSVQGIQGLTYDSSCFYFGSSGSPVFDKHCSVVAMHTAGYIYQSVRREVRSVMAMAQPLVNIIEKIIIQLVERKRFDVLKEYITCNCAHYSLILTNVKKLVESRNLTAFKKNCNDSVTTSDGILKKFFEFFCHRDEPIAMEIL